MFEKSKLISSVTFGVSVNSSTVLCWFKNYNRKEVDCISDKMFTVKVNFFSYLLYFAFVICISVFPNENDLRICSSDITEKMCKGGSTLTIKVNSFIVFVYVKESKVSFIFPVYEQILLFYCVMLQMKFFSTLHSSSHPSNWIPMCLSHLRVIIISSPHLSVHSGSFSSYSYAHSVQTIVSFDYSK